MKFEHKLLIAVLTDENKAIELINNNPDYDYSYMYYLCWNSEMKEKYKLWPSVSATGFDTILNTNIFTPPSNIAYHGDGQWRVDILFFAICKNSEKIVKMLIEKPIKYKININGLAQCTRDVGSVYELANTKIKKILGQANFNKDRLNFSK